MRLTPLLVVIAIPACGLELSGLGGAANDGGLLPDGGPATLPDGAPIGDGGIDIPTGSDGGADASPDATTTPSKLVYVTSLDALWSFNPTTRAFVKIGVFPTSCKNGSQPLDEIAVDSQGSVWANSRDQNAVFRVSTSPYQCTSFAAAGQPFALTFVKQGTVDPAADALVGFKDASYIRINTTTGAVTTITSNSITPYTVSGDVAAEGSKAYVSVKGGDCTLTDCLVEISPTTGAFLFKRTIYPELNIWALAVSGGKVYAFANSGVVYEWTPGTLAPVVVTPSTPVNEKWYGAGSSAAGP